MRTSLTRAGLVAAVAVLAMGMAACSSDSGPQDMGPADTAAGAATAGGPRADSDMDDGADSDTDDGAGVEPGAPVVVEEQPGEPPRTIDAGEGDYEFGLGRDSISETIETTYEDENASVEWEGDTMVVTMDGDADAPMAAWTECRVISSFVLEGDSVAIEFPNGRLECAEVMDR